MYINEVNTYIKLPKNLQMMSVFSLHFENHL